MPFLTNWNWTAASPHLLFLCDFYSRLMLSDPAATAGGLCLCGIDKSCNESSSSQQLEVQTAQVTAKWVVMNLESKGAQTTFKLQVLVLENSTPSHLGHLWSMWPEPHTIVPSPFIISAACFQFLIQFAPALFTYHSTYHYLTSYFLFNTQLNCHLENERNGAEEECLLNQIIRHNALITKFTNHPSVLTQLSLCAILQVLGNSDVRSVEASDATPHLSSW